VTLSAAIQQDRLEAFHHAALVRSPVQKKRRFEVGLGEQQIVGGRSFPALGILHVR
jgi:hypothetical protein